jgi:hypothetical protein
MASIIGVRVVDLDAVMPSLSPSLSSKITLSFVPNQGSGHAQPVL